VELVGAVLSESHSLHTKSEQWLVRNHNFERSNRRLMAWSISTMRISKKVNRLWKSPRPLIQPLQIHCSRGQQTSSGRERVLETSPSLLDLPLCQEGSIDSYWPDSSAASLDRCEGKTFMQRQYTVNSGVSAKSMLKKPYMSPSSLPNPARFK